MWIGTPAGVKEFGAEIRELQARLKALEGAYRVLRGTRARRSRSTVVGGKNKDGGKAVTCKLRRHGQGAVLQPPVSRLLGDGAVVGLIDGAIAAAAPLPLSPHREAGTRLGVYQGIVIVSVRIDLTHAYCRTSLARAAGRCGSAC